MKVIIVMKVVFINNFSINFGFLYVASVLEESGIEVEVVNYLQSKWDGEDQYHTPQKYFCFDEVAAAILEKKPDVVACSVYSPNFMFFKHTAEALRRKSSVPIIVGGVLPSLLPSLFMENTRCDYVFRGEAEPVIADLICNIVAGNKILDIPNLVYRAENGEVVANKMESYVKNLDQVPFYNKNLFPNSTKMLYVISSRGCPLTCAYCSAGVYSSLTADKGSSQVRKRSVDNVIEEIKLATEKKSYDEVMFFDDFFITNTTWLSEFKEKYTRAIGLPFSCLAFPATINKEIARLLMESGCKHVEMGFQTANEEYKSRVLQRKEKKETVIRAVNLLRDNGINVTLDHIFNFPGETKSQLEESLDFHIKNKIRSLAIFFLNYHPESYLTTYAHENGFLTDEQHAKILKNEMMGDQNFKGTILDQKQAHEKVQIAILFRLLSWLPGSAIKWMFTHNIYKLFPANRFIYFLVSIFAELRTRDLGYFLKTYTLLFGSGENKTLPMAPQTQEH